MSEEITNNADIESRITYKKALNKEIDSFIQIKTIQAKIKLTTKVVNKNLVILIQPIFHV